jgi:enoyl-CoA hydratase
MKTSGHVVHGMLSISTVKLFVTTWLQKKHCLVIVLPCRISIQRLRDAMTTPVLIEKKDAVAILTLNRPEAMNALSRGLRDAFVAAFEDFQADPAIRVVIVTGSGKAFCAGFDLKEMSEGGDASAAETQQNSMAEAMAAFEGPIIAAVNGHAITGGFEVALACDVIIASQQASFADTHARVGILPGWGLSQRLPRLIGLNRAKELSLSGNRISAEQACDWGLVNRVVPADELLPQCEQLANDMSSCVPAILKQYKKLIDDGFSMPFNEALAYEAKVGMASAQAASAAMIAARKDSVMNRNRNQGNKHV